jgi:hypothetical protein
MVNETVKNTKTPKTNWITQKKKYKHKTVDRNPQAQ